VVGVLALAGENGRLHIPHQFPGSVAIRESHRLKLKPRLNTCERTPAHSIKSSFGVRLLGQISYSKLIGFDSVVTIIMDSIKSCEFHPETIPGETVPTEVGYDRWAEVYDAEENPLVLLEETHIAPLIGKVAGLHIADIGCGTGRHSIRLAAAGAKVTALDFSEGMLERARAKPGANAIQFIRHDLTQPFPLESGSHDRVLCCLVLDHIADLKGFFSELGRICKPGGFVVISVMHPAMMLRGVQARFIEPSSGRRIYPKSQPNQISDYLMAAVHSRLQLEHITEHAVDSKLAAASPRAAKYLGWPLLLLMRLKAG
jgi:ubiquinone/menaquinone biosynthesis C-methylase UbiE